MCMYGYCRISQKKQSIDRQIRNIKSAYPEATIIEEAYTGTSIDRKEWNKLYKKVKKGDTIIFDSVSRMSRNADEGFTAYEELFTRGVELVFLKEPHINTATFKNAMEKAIPELIEEGYQLVTVSQLLTADGSELVPGGLYYNG